MLEHISLDNIWNDISLLRNVSQDFLIPEWKKASGQTIRQNQRDCKLM